MGLGRAGSGAVFPLRTLDPEDPDRSDLEALRGIVGGARVVCLGEGAHVTHEFLLARDRMTRFLVEQLGVSALVLESGYAEGLVLDRWVAGGLGELGELSVHAIGHGLGDNEPTRAQLAWLRAHGGVRVFGMDLPGSLPPGETEGVGTKAFQHLTAPIDATAFDAVLHVRTVCPQPGAARRLRAEVDTSPA